MATCSNMLMAIAPMSQRFDDGLWCKSEPFSESAFSALNISTTTKIVMLMVLAFRFDQNMSQLYFSVPSTQSLKFDSCCHDMRGPLVLNMYHHANPPTVTIPRQRVKSRKPQDEINYAMHETELFVFECYAKTGVHVRNRTNRSFK